MGEHERRCRGEVVEVYRRALPGSLAGEPREIVEVYRQRDPREVTERYSRPLPRGPRVQRTAASSSRGMEMRVVEVPVRTRADVIVHEPRRTRRKRRRGLWIFIGLVVFTAFVGVVTWSIDDPLRYRDPFEHFEWSYEPEREVNREITIPRWPTGKDAALVLDGESGREMTAQEVYRTVNPSVVTVLADIGEGRLSVGTGVIFTEDGYLVTNHHVVDGGSSCSVVLESGVRCEARYVAGDENQDLAVLKIAPEDLEDVGPLPAASFGDSDRLTVGDPVYAIGNPLGWELRGTLTDGIVSAINRDVEVDGRTMTLIQTNAALNSGNSGGPLINRYGQVVGINVIKMSSGYSTIEGLGFAIPSALMERMVNDLLQWGELQPEPSLGLMLMRLPSALEGGLQGLEVKEVTPGGSAQRAGIRTGDYVIAVGGEPVASSQEVLRIRRRCHLGDELRVTLWREGTTVDVTLTLDQAVE